MGAHSGNTHKAIPTEMSDTRFELHQTNFSAPPSPTTVAVGPAVGQAESTREIAGSIPGAYQIPGRTTTRAVCGGPVWRSPGASSGLAHL